MELQPGSNFLQSYPDSFPVRATGKKRSRTSDGDGDNESNAPRSSSATISHQQAKISGGK